MVRSTELLVAAALDGDRRAWQELVEGHSGLVWSIIRSMNIWEPDASDVFQNVFLRLTEHLGRIEPSTLPAWLVTVTKRASYDVTRGYQRRPVVSDQLDPGDDGSAGPEDLAMLADDEAAVIRALGQLSEACQRLLRLLASEREFSYTEISELLDMPIGSIGPTRARCLDRLSRTSEMQRLHPSRQAGER